jgi:hypothetical protein
LDQGGEDKKARKNRLGGQFPFVLSIFFNEQETGKQRDRQKNDQSIKHWRIHTGRQLANLGVHSALSHLNENSI